MSCPNRSLCQNRRMSFFKNFLLIVVVVFSCAVAFADDQGFETIPGQVQFSAYGSTNDNKDALFTTDIILPLYYPSTKDTLVFFNPKFTYTDPAAREYNIGAGIRHIFDDSYILGLGLFIDNREVRNGLYFMQAGVSLEYLSHPLDLRANWYKPTTGAKILDTTYSFASTSLIAHNNTMEALQGLDIEAGVPLLDKYTSTRGYVGGYFYQSQTAKDVNGFRARTETNLTNWLSIDTVFNSNIDKKEEFYGGLRVAVAFDLAQIGKGKVFSGASLAGRKATTLGDRLFDRVVRDIDIQSTTATTTSKAHDLIYVNNTNAGSQDGSLEHPYVAIQNGVNNATGGKWVFVEGQGASNYASDITLTDNVVLWGSGYNGGFKGVSVSGIRPVINGGTDGITLANNNTVMGMKIQNATQSGITMTPGTTLTGSLRENIITANGSNGISLRSNTGVMTNFFIANNTLTDNTNNGIDLGLNDGTMSGFIIDGNTIRNNSNAGFSTGFNGFNATGTIENFTIVNNVVTDHSNSAGLDFGYNGRTEGIIKNIVIANNSLLRNSSAISFANNGDDGNGKILNMTISGNDLSNSVVGGSGIYMASNGSSTGVGLISGMVITGNIIRNSDNDGITLTTNGTGGGTGIIRDVTISNNVITSNNNFGIALGNDAGGSMSNIVVGNSASNGRNSLFSNNLGDVSNDSGMNNLAAKYNWWGQASGPIAGQVIGANTVNSSSPLASQP